MELGTGLMIGISAGALFISLAAVIITIVKTRGTTTDNKADNKTERFLDHGGTECPLHPALAALVTETRDVVKSLAKDAKEDLAELRDKVDTVLLQMATMK